METNNQYVFKAHPDANKHDIKRAVQDLFKVDVTNVRTMNRKGKKKSQRRANAGTTAAWKRAVVTLADGNTIDLT
jgi:large subunit ribosomal protein L23